MDTKSLGNVAEKLTRRAALAAHRWVGADDPKAADRAAVEAMREVFGESFLQAQILSGEGQKDDAPRLNEGEALGPKDGVPVEVVVDPLDGTRLVARDRPGAISAVALGPPGSFPNFPEVYMMKLAGGPPLRGALDLSKPFAENLRRIAEVLERPLAKLRCAVVDRKRNLPYLETLRERDCRVHPFDHGDISAALRAALPDYDLDLLAGIGNAPEGLLAAAALQGLGGAMQARLSPRGHGQHRLVRDRPKLDTGRSYGIEELAGRSDTNERSNPENSGIIFACTGVTAGELVEGVEPDTESRGLRTESLVIGPEKPTVERIHSTTKCG